MFAKQRSVNRSQMFVTDASGQLSSKKNPKCVPAISRVHPLQPAVAYPKSHVSPVGPPRQSAKVQGMRLYNRTSQATLSLQTIRGVGQHEIQQVILPSWLRDHVFGAVVVASLHTMIWLLRGVGLPVHDAIGVEKRRNMRNPSAMNRHKLPTKS